MSKRYTGNFIAGGKPQVPSLTSNNGVFDIKDVYTATVNNAWQEPDGYYEIPKSLRIRGSANPYLSRVPSSSGNRTTFTLSLWVKPSLAGAQLFSVTSGNGSTSTQEDNRLSLELSTSGGFNFYEFASGSFISRKYSGPVFKDTSAWYHLICAVDYNQSVVDNRIKLYVNGVQVTTYSATTTPSQGLTSYISGSGNAHYVGGVNKYYPTSFDGYITEFYYIDGQALDPSYFGYFDPITNIWQPKPYTGGYGTNGFYLPFNEPAATSGTVTAINLGRNFAGGTNYIRYSQDGSQTSYGYTYERATNTVNNTTAPDGTTTANKLTADGTASNTHRFYCGTVATPSGSTQTASIYLKYNNCRYVNIENWNGSSYQTQTFDILNGVPMVGGSAVTAVGFTYQFVGNGWYRVSVPLYAGSANIGAPSIAIYLCDSSGNAAWNGDSTSAVYWWGAQINLGTTADPYFKTASSTTITNDWTTTNISLTAGTTYDSMVDSPTNVIPSLPQGIPSGYISYSVNQNNGTNINVSVPSNISAGDLLVAFGTTDSGDGTWGAPAGWTIALDQGSGATVDMFVAYKTATSSESTYTFTNSLSAKHTVQVAAFRGVSWGGLSSTDFAFSAGAVTAPALTSTVNNSIILTAFSCANNAVTFATPSGFTSIGTYNSSAPSQALFYKGGQLGGYSTDSATVDPSGTTGKSAAISILLTNASTDFIDYGGIISGNYCTWTPLIGGGLRAGSAGYSSNIVTLTDGNLSGSFTTNSGYAPMEYSMGTIPLPNAGKWYWEFTNLSNATCGVFKGQQLPLSGSGGGQEAFVGYSAGGSWILGTNAAGTTTGTALSASTSDIIGVAVDMDGKNIYFYKNNIYMGGITGFSDTNTGSNPASPGSWTTDCNMWIPIRGNDTSGSGGTSTVNFGQRPFTYTPPTGYKSLNTTNIQMLGTVAVGTAALTPNKWFDVSLYTGFGTAQQIKNSGKFQPDLVWVKSRNAINFNHILVDSVRGAGNILCSDLSNAESSGAGYWVTSLDQDGFTLGSAGANGTNATGYSYVAWQWKQSPLSGLNIVTYTGNGTTRTISHNLGVVPSMIWIKGRDTNASGGPGKWGANDWMVQHVGMGWGYQMGFNGTATSEAEGQLAAPTSSVFTVPSYGQVNYTGNRFVAYVWAEVPGFSKFGTYMGNNLADGPFVYTGFRPKYIMVKLINAVNSWEIWDSARSPAFNANIATGGSGTNYALFAEDQEADSQRDGAQFFANGFKLNATGSRSNNPPGNTFIYMAFAESPFYLNNRAK